MHQNTGSSVPVVPKPESSGSRDDMALASITVSSRVPEFWADQPRLWFVQFEAATENQRLGDAAKQNLVVTKLNKNAIQQVSDLLLSPPEQDKYQALKDRLLQVFEESETRQFQKLLGEMELGSQKPSQLLRRMRDLARGKIPDHTLQILWNSHLPSSVQAVLAATEIKDLENLASIADKVMEASHRSPEVAEVAAPRASTSTNENDLLTMVKQLRIEVAELRRTSRSQQRRPGASRQASRSRSRPRGTGMRRRDPDWKCFYHYRYGKRATKCIPPCSWKAEATAEAVN